MQTCESAPLEANDLAIVGGGTFGVDEQRCSAAPFILCLSLLHRCSGGLPRILTAGPIGELTVNGDCDVADKGNVAHRLLRDEAGEED